MYFRFVENCNIVPWFLYFCMMQQPLLRVEQLKSVFYQEDGTETVAVDGISFELNKGEVLGIVGESGSGKSITALTIAGLFPYLKNNKREGNIFFCGKDVLELDTNNLSAFRGKKVGMVFQDHMSSLNPSITCGEQISEGLQYHEGLSKIEAKSITLKWLQKVQLKDVNRIYNSYPHQLSGGQKQRVMIAMVLSLSPEVLIADEPTTALDVQVQLSILKLLKDIKEETDVSIIFISHDLGVIKQIANRVIVMTAGKIVEEGDVDQIFNAPAHSFTKGLIASRPGLTPSNQALPVLDNFLKDNDIVAHSYPSKEIAKSINALQIDVRNLQVWYSKSNWWGKKTWTKAVCGIDFQLYKGETLGIVGESGSGKTSLSMAILGFVKAKEGEMLLDGQRISHETFKARKEFFKKVQVIFQDPYASLNPAIKVGKSIEEVILFHRIVDTANAQTRVIELLEMVGLERAHYDRYPSELSGGQLQRVNIARAISLEPECLICDEAVSALDVSIQAKVLNLLREIQLQQQLSMIFISHDLSVVQYMSDRVLVLQNGEVVERGTPSEIYENAQHPYTQALINAIPKV